MAEAIDHLTSALATRYAIEREIGAGGMATVYVAEDVKHRRRVAIKVLSPELSAAIGRDRFLREIEIAAQLNHPHVLLLFDSGAVGDLLYFVMPYVEGESLRARLNRETQLSLDDALRLTREIASALGHAHQRGIVHRDIKPENILLADGIALVADFGIALTMRAARDTSSAALTRTGSALGTPTYMSPEQAAGDKVDERTDIYALACVLFEMLAGQPPFVGPTLDSLIRMHLVVEPRPVSDLRPTVPGGITAAIAKALSKIPADRFSSAARFAEALAGTGATPVPQPASAEPAPPNNLPKLRTRFIGREEELAEGAAALGDARLVTLVGIGGAGKTRLAVRLAEGLLDGYPDGVWFVDLAPVVDESRVPEAVARAVGASEAPGKTLSDVLAQHMRGKRALLLLDNCEHVVGACRRLADELLTAGDLLRIVATSREGLGVDGERLLALRSLGVPPAGAAPDLASVAAADAVKLFVDRAQSVVRDFALTADNAAAISEICRRLDGIPLAIELAASRTKVLSVEQIRARLDDRFRLLSGGSSTTPLRHQTLAATIQWSYDQLTDDEQQLFRQLSVFAGGWNLEAAAGVAGDPDEFRVLDLLARLIDKSLVTVQRDSTADARYRLLETVRQYGQERLADAGEAGAVRDRHAGFYTALAERAYAERFVREEHWSPMLETEHDNLRAALALLRREDPERYLQLAGALALFWWGRSHIMEGREQVSAALEAAAAAPPRPVRARALWGNAFLISFQGEGGAAITGMVEALEMWRTLGDRAEIAIALEGVGWAQFMASDDEAACRTFQEALALQRAGGNRVLINRAMVGLAQSLVTLSRVSEARPMATDIVAFSRAHNDKRSEHSGWHFLADCALIEERYGESLGLYQRALSLAWAIGDRAETSFELQGVAMSLVGLGDVTTALRMFAAGRAEWRRLGVDPHVRFWDALLDRYEPQARAALGADATARLEGEGRLLTLDEAVALAVDAVAEAGAARDAGWAGTAAHPHMGTTSDAPNA